MAAWVKTELGAEAKNLVIKPRTGQPLKGQETNEAQCVKLFNKLPHEQRLQILKAMERPEVMRSIPPLNALFESMRQ